MDFEGRNPLDCDFDGIKQLLLQLFLKGKVNLNELSELIISQNTIGSVLSQCLDEPAVPEPKAGKKEGDAEEDGAEEEDSDDEDDNTIFGVTSIVNLSNPEKKDCVKQLRSYFLDKSQEGGDKEVTAKLKNLLEDESHPTGFIINERFINIPAQIAVPMLENLQKEMKRAVDKKMPYKFDQYLMVIKFHRSKQGGKTKKAEKNRNKVPVVHYSNPEEEVFDKDLLLSYEFSVASDADTGLTGNWLEGDMALTPYRRVIAFEAKNLSKMIEQIKELIE